MMGCVLYELTTLKKPFEGENFTVKFFYFFFIKILEINTKYSLLWYTSYTKGIFGKFTEINK